MSHPVTNEELPVEAMMQAAMSAYVDEALKKDHAHDRLVRASRAAGLAVAGVLREEGLLRTPIAQVAVHGSYSGYSCGCRCDFCAEAGSVYNRARKYWTASAGHNKVGAA